MKHIEKILVVVDPTVDRDFVADRLRDLLKVTKASVRFFINSANTLTQHNFAYEGIDGNFFANQRKLFTDHYNNILGNLVDEFTALGFKAAAEFTEEHHLADAIISQAKQFTPDLVMKSTHHHGMLKRHVISNTDWNLIRNCPCPLMLVKPRGWQSNGSVVAAVDPLHVKAKQSTLDHILIETAQQVATQFKQTARVFHSYYPFVSTMFPTVTESTEHIEAVRKRHEVKMQELLAAHQILKDCVEMSRGDLVPTMIRYLEKSNANMLVIGALSRNLIERTIVGNTAEKILDDCPCDVLIIKP